MDDFWLVADGTVKPFEGDLDDYRAWCAKSWQLYKQDKNQVEQDDPSNAETSTVNKREARQQATQNRIALANAQKPLKQQLSKLEKTLHSAQTEHSELQNWLASESAYAPEHKDTLAEKVRRTSELATQIEQLEENWLMLHEELEAIEVQLN